MSSVKESFFKKNIKHIVIFYQSQNLKIKNKIIEIKNFLEKKNIAVHLASQRKNSPLHSADLLLSLGGDGTYLKAVKYGRDIPILGINMGSLGFLTPYPSEQTIPLLKKTLQKKMFLKKNHFLKSCIYEKNSIRPEKTENLNAFYTKSVKIKKQFYSVNDIVIERGSFSHLIHISIFINKKLIYSLKSDGLIISSPLGSTAYNLASGGPILHPKVSGFVVTPICSHSLTSRPVVIPDHSEVHLQLNKNKAYLTIDGINQTKLSSKNIIRIKKDKSFFLSLVEKKEEEFSILRKKLKFGERD